MDLTNFGLKLPNEVLLQKRDLPLMTSWDEDAGDWYFDVALSPVDIYVHIQLEDTMTSWLDGVRQKGARPCFPGILFEDTMVISL